MKLKYILASIVMSSAVGASAQTSLNVFDKVVFYNGYEETVIDSALNAQDGILRHTNYVYAKKLTDDVLSRLGENLTLDVAIGVQCDNYDRLANLSLAFVPKGSTAYEYDKVERIELARFITPFMRINKQPDSVPYEFNDPGLSMILRDSKLREEYDFWMEFECFGMPQKYTGCPATRKDTFNGSLNLLTDSTPAPMVDNNILVPVAMKKTECFGPVNLNNYHESATDTLGVCTKTWRFEMPEDASDARLVLITSNHGANVGEDADGNEIPGEEYARRRHLAYFDGDIKLDYTPGGVSCEPYRKYNTQANFIYGDEAEYEENMEFWLTMSNWCPGAAIPMRYIELGDLKAGSHEMMIRVPEAQFVDSQGDFYVSAYVHGVRSGQLPAEVKTLAADAGFTFLREGDTIYFSHPTAVEASELVVYTFDGQMVYGTHRPGTSFDITPFASGSYILSVRNADGVASTLKFLK